MIPHVRNDSRAGLGGMGNGHFRNGTRNGGPFTEVRGTIELDEIEVRRSPVMESSEEENEDDGLGNGFVGNGEENHIQLVDLNLE